LLSTTVALVFQYLVYWANSDDPPALYGADRAIEYDDASVVFHSTSDGGTPERVALARSGIRLITTLDGITIWANP
jgi:hypothetical protein